MPVYNCAAFIPEALGSIRRQTWTDWELVIVDDGSTDGSRELLGQAAKEDERITVITQPNAGIVSALNAGLEACQGQFIARIDGDDVADRDRLGSQLKFLQGNPEIGGVGGQAIVIDESGRDTGRIENPTDPAEVDEALDRGEYAILHPTLMVRRDCLKSVGNYDLNFSYAEDLDLLLRLREVTKLANLPQTVLKYRRRSDSMTDMGRSKYPVWDQKALLATHVRRRRPVPASTLARAAERVSWTSLEQRDYWSAVAHAWQAVRHAPLHVCGPRALSRVAWRLATGRLPVS